MMRAINAWCLWNRKNGNMLFHCPDHPLRAQLLAPGSILHSAFSPVLCVTRREAEEWRREWNAAFDGDPSLAVSARRCNVIVDVDEPAARRRERDNGRGSAPNPAGGR